MPSDPQTTGPARWNLPPGGDNNDGPRPSDGAITGIDGPDPDCQRCRGGGCEWCGNTGLNRAIDRISWPAVMHPTAAKTAPMRCNGIGRNAEWPKSLMFYFNAVPTDGQMRYLQEVVARAVACMPEDLR